MMTLVVPFHCCMLCDRKISAIATFIFLSLFTFILILIFNPVTNEKIAGRLFNTCYPFVLFFFILFAFHFFIVSLLSFRSGLQWECKRKGGCIHTHLQIVVSYNAYKIEHLFYLDMGWLKTTQKDHSTSCNQQYMYHLTGINRK